MTLNRFWILFFSTMGIGILTGLSNAAFGWFGTFSTFYGMEVGGFVSATSLMGFWAYLMLNFTANSFLPRQLWNWIQLVVIAFAVYDLIYFRHEMFGGPNAPWLSYIQYGLYPLIWALLVAIVKVRLTNQRAFIPTVFYMYVFTVLEWYVALKANVMGVTETIGFILMICNAWLILILGKLLVRRNAAGPSSATEPPHSEG